MRSSLLSFIVRRSLPQQRVVYRNYNRFHTFFYCVCPYLLFSISCSNPLFAYAFFLVVTLVGVAVLYWFQDSDRHLYPLITIVLWCGFWQIILIGSTFLFSEFSYHIDTTTMEVARNNDRYGLIVGALFVLYTVVILLQLCGLSRMVRLSQHCTVLTCKLLEKLVICCPCRFTTHEEEYRVERMRRELLEQEVRRLRRMYSVAAGPRSHEIEQEEIHRERIARGRSRSHDEVEMQSLIQIT
jgi:hypothetical protein